MMKSTTKTPQSPSSPSSTTTSSSSSWNEWRQSLNSTVSDMSSWMLGDDTGIPQKIVMSIDPEVDGDDDIAKTLLFHQRGIKAAAATTKRRSKAASISKQYNYLKQNNNNNNNNKKKTIACFGGMVLTEIQGRAYVCSVTPGSVAERHGIQPRDCLHWCASIDKTTKSAKTRAIQDESKGYRISFDSIQEMIFKQYAMNQAKREKIASERSVPLTIQVGGGGGGSGSGAHRRMPARREGGVEDEKKENNHHNTTTTTTTKRPSDYNTENDDGSGNGSTSTTQWIFIFCRTQQRLPNTTWWPHFRLDDECRIAAERLVSIPKSPNSNSNIAGLALVTCHKVAVVGVSLVYGSGIVVAKLSDGTWSAPCAIGLWGMGVGLQLGVERTQVLFVLETAKALHEFCTVGSLTVGARAINNATTTTTTTTLSGSKSSSGGSGGVASTTTTPTATATAAVSPLSGIFCGTPSSSSQHFNFDDDDDDDNIAIRNGGICNYYDNSGTSSSNNNNNNNTTSDYDYNYHRNNNNHNTSPHHHLHDDEYTVASSDNNNSNNNNNDNSNDGGGGVPTGLRAYVQTSHGLYVGISLEGSKLFARDDVNARVYQIHSNITTTPNVDTILTGKVPPPPDEAVQMLYKKLHRLELQAELLDVYYNKMNTTDDTTTTTTTTTLWQASQKPLLFKKNDEKTNNNNNNKARIDACTYLLQGGFPVEHMALEKLLWLCTPEKCHSLHVGLLVQPGNGGRKNNNNNNNNLNSSNSSNHSKNGDLDTIGSEDLTLDSAILDNQSLLFQGSVTGGGNTTAAVRKNIELSSKHSVALVDVVTMSLKNNQIRLNTSRGRQLVFEGTEPDHARLLFQALVTLLESETARLGIRGGVRKKQQQHQQKMGGAKHNKNKSNSLSDVLLEEDDNEDSENDGDNNKCKDDFDDTLIQWSRLPGRKHLRQIAAAHQDGTPKYVHGQLLVRDLAKQTVRLPLPLSICRVLLLDSNSVVMEEWQKRRNAYNNNNNNNKNMSFEKTAWTFPPATPREQESSYSNESELIANGSMCGAHRTWSSGPSSSKMKQRKGRSMFRLSETHIVDADDSEQLTIQIQERTPRRGFSIKVKVMVRPFSEDSCEASVFAEVRPVGKNMSNPATVHKAFLVVLDELKTRYHVDLLAGFSQVADQYSGPSSSNNKSATTKTTTSPRSKSPKDANNNNQEEKKDDAIKIQDMFQENASLAKMESHDARRRDDRRPTPSRNKDRYKNHHPSKQGAAGTSPPPNSDTFEAAEEEGPVMIEVKPLPKIRLSLMPSPREEDEYKLDENGDPIKKKNGKSSSNSRRRSSSKPSKKRSNRPRSKSRTKSSSTSSSASSRGSGSKASFSSF